MPDKEEVRAEHDDDAESRTERAASEQPDPLADAIAAQLGEVDNTVAFRDEKLAALLAALDDRPEDRARLAELLQDAIGRDEDRRTDPEDVDRSELLRLLVRAGLSTGAPEFYEDLGDAIRQSIEV
jgi:hypothetical protein